MGLCPGSGLAQEASITRRHHPWGCFAPGAWKLVRVVTETLDEKGAVTNTSTTETKTALVKVEEDGVTLRIEVQVEVAGKRFEAEPQTVKQDFHGVLASQKVKAKDLPASHVVIEGQKIPCKVRQLEYADTTSKTLMKIYYSDQVTPYVLKRESVTTDPEGKTTLSETSMQVVALNMPCKVLAEIKTAAHIKAVNKHAKGTTSTLAVISPEVPGGVIGHTSKEVDAAGRPIRRSALELIDYGLEPDSNRPGLLRRVRPGRHRNKSGRHTMP